MNSVPTPSVLMTIDMFIVSLNASFDDGKSEASSFFILSAGQVGLVKAFPDFIQFFFWNSHSGILDRNKNLLILFGDLNRDRRVVSAEFDRIINEIVKNLLNLPSVCIHENIACQKQKLNGNPFACAGAFERGGSVLDHLLDIKLCLVQDHFIPVKLVECQKILCQICQTFRLKENDIQIF